MSIRNLPDHPDILSCQLTGYPRDKQEQKSVFVCSECGQFIYNGDLYWEYFGEQYCEYCNKEHRSIAVTIED